MMLTGLGIIHKKRLRFINMKAWMIALLSCPERLARDSCSRNRKLEMSIDKSVVWVMLCRGCIQGSRGGIRRETMLEEATRRKHDDVRHTKIYSIEYTICQTVEILANIPHEDVGSFVGPRYESVHRCPQTTKPLEIMMKYEQIRLI